MKTGRQSNRSLGIVCKIILLSRLVMIVIPSIFVTLSTRAAESPQELRPALLRMLYSESLFSGVNHNDAIAAIKSWVETLGRRRGFRLTVEIGFYDRLDEVTARIQRKTLDMINCTSLEYLQLAPSGQIEPLFIPAWNRVTDDYVLLTRRDRNLAILANLRGKNVVFYRTGDGLGRIWLDAALDEQGLGSVNSYFGSQTEASKVSTVILPVFFGKADVAVAKRYGWETMKEMNPQLEVQLQMLTNSPSLTDALTCLTKDTRENPFRDDLIRGISELHTDPQGQQILLLFKTDKMAPFLEEYLDPLRKLRTRLNPLPKEGKP